MECKLSGGGSEYALKIGLLMFIFSCLLRNGNSYNAPIDIGYVHAVDDVRYMNSYH